ncbi:MAG: hypothetical protein H0U57_08680 [Tatlockia sp.]|nr:hypothetical protein [Tatlockia sp.]
MSSGILKIKLTKFQRQKWESNYQSSKIKAEQKKPFEPSDTLTNVIVLGIGILGLILTIVGAFTFWPVLVMGAVILLIPAVVVAVEIYMPLWNWITDAHYRYEQACENLKKLEPDYIFEQKLKKLIECGKFSSIDFSSHANQDSNQNEVLSGKNFIPDKVFASILELVSDINQPIILESFDKPKIGIRYNDKNHFHDRAYYDMDIDTNNHYQHGLFFFTLLKRTELPFEIVNLIATLWSNFSGYKTNNCDLSIKFLLATKHNFLANKKIERKSKSQGVEDLSHIENENSAEKMQFQI